MSLVRGGMSSRDEFCKTRDVPRQVVQHGLRGERRTLMVRLRLVAATFDAIQSLRVATVAQLPPDMPGVQ